MSVNIEPKRIQGKMGSTLCYTFTPEITEITGGINLKIPAYRLYTPEGNLQDEKGKYYAVPGIEENILTEEVDFEFMIIQKGEETYLLCRYLDSIEPIPGEYQIQGLEGDIVLSGVIPSIEGEPITLEYKEVYDGN